MIKYSKDNNKHIITFKIDNKVISYKDFNKMVNECKDWYNKEIKSVIKDYNQLLKYRDFSKSLEISHRHKVIIIKLIKKVLSYYEIINDFDFGLFISNSFARGTNLLNSDIDLNFVYEKENFDIGLQIEETVSYALSLILNKYRDFVHDSIVHRMKMRPSNIEYNDDDELEFICKWPRNNINYKVTHGNEKMLLNYCYGDRSIMGYTKYISYYISDNEVNEWVYYQNIIFNKKYVENIFDNIVEKEKQLNKYTNNNILIKNTIKKYNDIFSSFKVVDYNDIKNFKQYFKNLTYTIIFTTISTQKKINNNYDFEDIYYYFKNIDNNYRNLISEYFGNIMQFSYICNVNNIEFRTRYSNIITDDIKEILNKNYKDYIKTFIKLSKNIYKSSIRYLKRMIITNTYKSDMVFNPNNEWTNISNYSPFAHINEVSTEYQKKPFLLQFIKLNNKKIPVHPDTFSDLNLSYKTVVDKLLVYPTSSYRTVYDPANNVCYKLPLLRKITRSTRNLPNKELDRSVISQKLLNKYQFNSFEYLKEKCIYNENEIYNYIIRDMPKTNTYPWFYVIASQKFSKSFQLKCITNIIKSWMFYASKGIYFESPHTQNYLVDKDANIYYRDLSDIRNLDYEIMTPSYYNLLENDGEMLAVFFDRALCNQNLDHLVRYCKNFNNRDFIYIKNLINSEIKKYNLKFPNYSMDYSKEKRGHIPVKIEKVKWR